MLLPPSHLLCHYSFSFHLIEVLILDVLTYGSFRVQQGSSLYGDQLFDARTNGQTFCKVMFGRSPKVKVRSPKFSTYDNCPTLQKV